MKSITIKHIFGAVMTLKEGDIVRRRVTRRECCVCGEPATRKHTFLLPNARRNPASSAYRKDDCSWCEDGCEYTCGKHTERDAEKLVPEMKWCTTFQYEGFPHMFLYEKRIEEEPVQE